MLNRRVILAVFSILIAPTASYTALAFDKKPFDQNAFEAAQSAGKSILIDVSAPWCPTCRVQARILSDLRSNPRFKDMAMFSVDFDTKKDVLRAFSARSQSTLIVFKGKQEKGRSVGETNPARIEELLAKSL